MRLCEDFFTSLNKQSSYSIFVSKVSRRRILKKIFFCIWMALCDYKCTKNSRDRYVLFSVRTHQFNEFQKSGHWLKIGWIECDPTQWASCWLLWSSRFWWWWWWLSIISIAWFNCDHCFWHHFLLFVYRLEELIPLCRDAVETLRTVLWEFHLKILFPPCSLSLSLLYRYICNISIVSKYNVLTIDYVHLLSR